MALPSHPERRGHARVKVPLIPDASYSTSCGARRIGPPMMAAVTKLGSGGQQWEAVATAHGNAAAVAATHCSKRRLLQQRGGARLQAHDIEVVHPMATESTSATKYQLGRPWGSNAVSRPVSPSSTDVQKAAVWRVNAGRHGQSGSEVDFSYQLNSVNRLYHLTVLFTLMASRAA